jgi:hypothetical protein
MSASGALSGTNAPTFTDFTNAQHDHGDADDGGLIPSTSVTGLGLVWLATNTPSGVVTSTFTSQFTSTYDQYLMIGRVSMSATNAILAWRSRSGSTDLTSASYTWNDLAQASNAGTIGTGSSNSDTSIALFTAAGVGVTRTDCSFTIMMDGPFATNETLVTMDGCSRVDTPLSTHFRAAGMINNTTSYDGCTIFASTGNITGTTQLFGVRKS